ncbi:MAG TPA: hypothetical protein VH157_15360 [Bryobacteraceae bacterium]|nr:hypothetical protein [Bryobacteraceae bacterium]
MPFDSKAYGTQVAEILALDQNGQRLIPLVSGVCSSDTARKRLKEQPASDLFPQAYAPQEALGGLWLYFSCFDECHEIVQDLKSPEASFWHAILHRQEPDAGNSSYWFHCVGAHPVFPDLLAAAKDILSRHPDSGFQVTAKWDPISFVNFCEQVRKESGSPSERVATEIQRAEWQLLFDYCARPRS